MKVSVCYFLLMVFILVCACGCILPILHTRVSAVGCEGIVSDARTGKPINGAIVTVVYPEMNKIAKASTGPQGRYKVSDETNWHAAFFIGIPISFSLFPFLDAPMMPTYVSVTAEGYANWEWHLWFDIDEDGNITEDTSDNDPSNIKLQPIRGGDLIRH